MERIFSKRIGSAVGAGLLCSILGAQPICSIDLGPDQTICDGASLTLQGPAGYNSYLWSNGATTASITVSSAGDYWCQVGYPSGELVTNGDFSAGNTGFSSQYTYSLFTVQNEGMYTVGPNASWYHNQFQGTGTGNFLIANGGYVSWLNGQHDVWCQTIPCCPGQTYTLGFWGLTLSNALPGRVVWAMDGVLAHWPDFTLPAYNAGWQQFTTTWTAGPGQTSVQACLMVTSGDGVGDDMGFDNISISGMVYLRDTIHVSATPRPPLDLGPDPTLCDGDQLSLDVTVPGATYLWQDGSTAPTFTISQPGTYSVTVTAQNCTSTDQITAQYQALPQVDLGNDLMLCDGTTQQLTAPGQMDAYLWQDGSTGQTHVATHPGWYWVDVEQMGCTIRDSVWVGYKPLPTVDLGGDVTICDGETVALDASFPGADHLWQDGSTDAILVISASGTYEVTVDLDGCTATDQAVVDVLPLPAVDLGVDQYVCPGEAVTFQTGVNGASYLWSDGSTSSTLTTDQPGSYSVAVTLAGCMGHDTVALFNHVLQTVDLGPDLSICQGAGVRVGCHVPGATYQWNNGAVTDSITINSAGIHWLETTLNGCAVRDSVEVFEIPAPTVVLGPNLQVCPDGTAYLDVAMPGGSYLWSTGATTSAIDAGAGTWAVEVTVNGCSTWGSITITEYPAATVTLGPDTMLCPGQTLLLDVFQPGASYLWNNGATNATIAVDVPTTAIVTLTDSHGCTASDTVEVSFADPGVVLLGGDTSFCTGGTARIGTHLPGASYLWSTGATTDSISVNVDGTYWVEVMMGGCSIHDTLVVVEVAAPVISLGPDVQVCPGGSVILSTSLAGASHLWSNGSTAESIQAGPGAWSVEVTVDGCMASAGLTVSEYATTPVDLGPDLLLCPGQEVVLETGIANGSHLWSTGETGASIMVGSDGPVWVAVTDMNGCTVADTVQVALVTAGPPDLGPDLIVCAGTLVHLDATIPGATVYSWNNGLTGPVLETTDPGTYWIEVEAGNCTYTDTVVVTHTPPMVISLGNDTTLCPGETWLLQPGDPGLSLEWQDGSHGSNFLVSMAGAYQVTATDAYGCVDSAMVHVAYLNQAAVDLGPDATICIGDSMELSVGLPNGVTQWSGASTANTPAITVVASGTYIATTTVAGCSFTDSVHIQVVGPPWPDLGPDTTICTGDVLVLHAAGGTVLWDDGSTGATRTVGQGGIFWVQVGSDGCLASDTVVVAEIALPVINLGPDTSLCGTDVLPMDVAVPNGSYLWSDGGVQPERMLGPGAWQVQVTLEGCTASDSLVIHGRPVPELALPMDTMLCAGAVWIVDVAQDSSTYLWSTGSTASMMTVEDPGSYTITVDRLGCTASATIQVEVVDLSSFSLGADTTLCPGNDLMLSVAIPGASVVWEDGTTSPLRPVSSTGIYSAAVSLQGCTVQDSLAVTFIPIPALDLGPDQVRCIGDTVILLVEPGDAQLAWNTGDTAVELEVTETGLYTATLSLDGCTESDVVHLEFRPVITEVDLGPDTVVCMEAPILLDATTPGGIYLWNDGSTAPGLSVNRPGEYQVSITGQCIEATGSITLAPGDCAPQVFVPNAFTPDADGINDLFAPVVQGKVDRWTFLVFNRWGGLVFSSRSPNEAWDGLVDGQQAPTGVYVWDLHYEAVAPGGVVQQRVRGSVTLLR